MNSSIYDERISSYLDDALPAAERSAFQAQLACDPELRQHVAELQQLRQDVASLPRYSVKEGFANRVVAAAVAAGEMTKPATTKVQLPRRAYATRTAVTSALAVAAALAFLAVGLPWFSAVFQGTSNEPIANNPINNTPIVADEVNPLAAVRAALPGEGETLVLRIRSPKDLAAGKLLRDALAEQGIEKRRPADGSTGAPLVGKAYRDQLRGEQTEQKDLTQAADALYVEMSAAELELALSRLAEPHKALQFVPERKLAVAKPAGIAVDPNNSAGESAAVTSTNAPTGDFVQEMSASLFRLPKASEGLKPSETTGAKIAPQGKVRVLILIEAGE